MYVKTLGVIRTPMAWLCCATVPKCARLHRRIRVLIIANRTLAALTVISAGVAIIFSYWLLFATLSMALVWYFGVNPRQTAANIDLAARVEVFCATASCDAHFREGVVAMVAASNDPDLSASKDSIAVFLQSLADVPET